MIGRVTRQIHDIGKRRAWVIWGVALSVYLLAVFHRSSLGVAGLLAAERFDVDATQLAMFTVLQLVVYAGMQVPVGVLLDRFGSRAMLLTGLGLMTAGQFWFAFAESFPAAVLARAVLGAGDAMIFVSVIRLVASWFLVRQAPLVTQLTGHDRPARRDHRGRPAVVGAAAARLDPHVRAGVVDRGRPDGRGGAGGQGLAVRPHGSDARSSCGRWPGRCSTVWGNPGTRLGMWSHFTPQFSTTVFAMLWGFPFLVRGQGLSEQTASTLLMVMTGFVVVSGLVLGWLVSRLPVLPLLHRHHGGAGHGGAVDRGAAARHPRAAVAARGARLRDRRRRPGLHGRLRPRAVVHAAWSRWAARTAW